MKVERRTLKSISEFSIFKYVLVAYLIFFILFVIIFAVVGLIGWALLATSGMSFQEVLSGFMPGLDIDQTLGTVGLNVGGGVIGIIIFVIVGLVASVFAAALAALVVWILNIILRITGGIELRFAPAAIVKENTNATINVNTSKAAEEKNEKVYQNYDLDKEQ